MSDQFKMLAERRAPGPPVTARSPTPAQRVTPGHPDQSAWPPMPAQRKADKDFPVTKTAPKYRAKRPPNLSWPNNVVIKPRRKMTTSTSTPPPASSWQWPSGPSKSPDTTKWMRAPKSPTKPAWDKDFKWVPPKMSAAPKTTASSRPKRSTNKPVNYNDDDSHMDAAFSKWS